MEIFDVAVSFFFILLHATGTGILFVSSIVSNRVRVLIAVAAVSVLIKISHIYHGRCVLTQFEHNDVTRSSVEILGQMLYSNSTERQTEEIVINGILLILLTKICVLSVLHRKIDAYI